MDISQLASRLREGRLFHSYIITGADSGAIEDAANLVAQAAVCSGDPPLPCGKCRDCRKALRGIHPDISHVELAKDAKEHTVDSMRVLRAAAYVSPNEGSRSVYIIHAADAMNVQAQNAMLKVLEEPPGHVVFILLANNPERLLPTVRSRCETVRLVTASGSIQDDDTQAAALLEDLLSGDPLIICQACLTLEKLSRLEFTTVLDRLRRYLAISGINMEPVAVSRARKIFDTASKYLEANVSSGHVSGLIMAGFVDPDHFDK